MRRSLRREDSFAAAFPSTAYHGAESRVRFGGQFVGNIKQGQLTGLPAGLKLITHDSSKDPKLLLTSAGLKFALLENPVLDLGDRVQFRKLGEAEMQFLLGQRVEKEFVRQVIFALQKAGHALAFAGG